MKRIVIHWTGGSSMPSDLDRKHYHVLIDGEGRVSYGDLKPEANLSTADGQYAAHTRALNTGSIGVALCGMFGAKERPFSTGNYPLTAKQLNAAISQIADLCDTYNIPVTRQTVLTHAEVQPTLGVKQYGKWDITWLPGMKGVGDAIAVGDEIRASVKQAMRFDDGQAANPFAAILAFLKQLFGG